VSFQRAMTDMIRMGPSEDEREKPGDEMNRGRIALMG